MLQPAGCKSAVTEYDFFSTLLEMLHYRVGSALEQGMVGPVKMLKFSTEKFIPKTLIEENI